MKGYESGAGSPRREPSTKTAGCIPETLRRCAMTDISYYGARKDLIIRGGENIYPRED